MTRRRRDSELLGLVDTFRDIRNDYDAAKRTRFKRTRTGVQRSGSGSDYHYRTEDHYFGMMETARDLFRNHCLVAQGVRRLVSNVLRGGFALDVRTGDKDADKSLTDLWRDWAEDPDQCDTSQEHTFRTMERLAFQSVIVDGDILTLPARRTGSIQQVEAHRLRTPRRTKRNVVHGVLLDGYRRRREYWLTKQDIDPLATVSLVADVHKYPVRDRDGFRRIFHHYMPDRVSQTRGLSAFAPAIDTAGMGDDLMFAHLVKAQMSACITLLREMDGDVAPGTPGEGQETSSETRADGTSRTLAGWQPGMEIFGFPGERLSGFSPNVPNDTFFEHAMLILAIVAVNLDLPLQVLLLDPKQTNFSGWRGAMNQAQQRYRDLQLWFAENFHSPIYRWRVRHWIATNPTLAKDLGKAGLNPYGHRWQARGADYIEPMKDAQADELKVATAQTSPRRRAADRGIDWEDLTVEIVDDLGSIIERAFEKADKLNAAHEGLDLTWRDLIPRRLFDEPASEPLEMELGSEEGAPTEPAI
jgi:lambda family phage portal protein